jgi:hypothetical protein
LNEPYFESVTTPHFQAFQNFSGWSGTDARLSSGISAGATSITVNDAAGISIGNTIRIVNINTGFEENRSVTNKVGNVLTLSSGTSSAHPAGSFVGTGMRTHNPLCQQYFVHHGGGDCYAIVARGTGAYSALAGQDHIFFTATTGLFGGDLSATAPHQYLTGIEIDHKDLSNPCGAVGVILNFQRTNAGVTRGEFWHGVLIKSEGNIAMDSAFCALGSIRTGIDLANAVSNYQSWGAAVGLKRGDGVFFNNQSVAQTLASGLPSPYSLTARAIGDTQIRTNLGASDNYIAAAARAGDLEYRLQSQYVLASTASSGQPQVTLVSSALAAGLQAGQVVRIFDPSNSAQQDVTISAVSGAIVTFTSNLTSAFTAGSVLLMEGASVTARHRIFVRGVETMTIGSQISTLRQLNVQNPGGSEVTGLNLTNNTNITSHSFPAGGATALPATPRIYIPVKIDGTVYYIPGYN